MLFSAPSAHDGLGLQSALPTSPLPWAVLGARMPPLHITISVPHSLPNAPCVGVSRAGCPSA